MIFRVKAKGLHNFAEIIDWLSAHATDADYHIASSGGSMLIKFTDHSLAIQCKLMWSEYMELV